MWRMALMTPALVGFELVPSRPLIIKSAPSQPLDCEKVGKSVEVKWSYFSRAACIALVPALGSWKGWISARKIVPWSCRHDGELIRLGLKPTGRTSTLSLIPASAYASGSAMSLAESRFGQRVFTPSCLAISAVVVKLTLPNGTEVSLT